ncbi:OLC1v1021143C1 [Oldenlandia corymbosa var. corymbosa]|uniref:OLC1v1021143C1 n=1 Tax=Oldenlandia corymbosa var. corymbosa TaxID=529605 RepID=A0AAV1BV13_OLDCO|nr:OLC1v1021143C1 [Oldenlandia corymbosa var. corymbosa]
MMARRLGQVDEYHHHHQGNNSIRYTSSLALLQERFNQLQKTREMRLEKELMMMKLISTAAVNSTLLYHQYVPPSSPSMPSCSQSTYDSDMVMFHQNKPSSHLGFSLIQPPQLVKASASSQQTKSSSSSSWLFGTNLGLTCKFDDSSSSDVDTSLHL